jgi:hypothetical protein
MLDPYITDKVPTPPQDTESPENPFRKLMLESHEILERERYVEESRKKEKEKETADELALFLQNRMPSSLSDWKDSRTFPFSCRHVKYTVLEDIPPHLMVPLYHQLRDADLKFRAIPRSGLKRLFSRKKQDIEKIYVWFEVC